MKNLLKLSLILISLNLSFSGYSQDSSQVAIDSIPLEGILVDSVTMRLGNGENEDSNALDDPNSWNSTEMEAFFDGLMGGHLEANHIAGATISIVRDGKVFFAKGYGHVNKKSKEPVDPDKSLFYIGSVSKLITWTALMQLEEKGKINLEEDVNTYLKDFSIPKTFEKPITPWNLLTHTTGFEDIGRIFAHSADEVIPLGEYMKDRIPKRVMAPGEYSAYSNYGASLAGYLVQEISGETFDDYVDKNIFQPLGMKNSTFRQPQPENLKPNVSQGYSYQNGRFVLGDAEFVHPAPAGVMVSSATDMARFMITHLQNGIIDTTRILEGNTASNMHKRQFWHDDQVNGMCLGFYEMNQRGYRIIGHGGDTEFFHSQLALIPEEQTGIFISFNSVDGPKARKPILDAFLERYFADNSKEEDLSDGEVKDADNFIGNFRSNRMIYSTYEKVAGIFSVMNISVNDKGRLVAGSFMGDSKVLSQVGPRTFVEPNDDTQMVFEVDKDGEATHLFLKGVPVMALEKISWYESPNLHFWLFLTELFLFLSMVILWPVSLYAHRVRKNSGGKVRSPAERTALSFGRLTSFVFLLFVGGLLLVFANPTEAFVYGPSPIFKYVLFLPWIGGIIALLAFVVAFIAIKKKYWNGWVRIQFLLASLASITFIVQLYYFNLLTLSF